MGKRLRAAKSYYDILRGRNVPLTVRALVTTNCNLRCTHCKVYERKSDEMSLSDWLKAVDKLAELGTVNTTFQGGEPLLRADLPDILAYSHEKMFTNVTTNGVLLRKKLSQIASVIDSLTLSVDSFTDTGYGKSVDESLLEEIREASIEYGFRVQPVCVLNRKNMVEVEQLIRLADSYGFGIRINAIHSDVNHNKWMFRGYSPETEFREEDVPDLQTLVNRLVVLKKSGVKITNFIEHLLQIPRYFAGERWECDAGRLYFDINPDGRIMPCQDLPPTGITIHELKKDSYYQHIIEAGGAETVKECGGNCVYDCTWQTSYATKHPLEVILTFK